MRDSTSEMTASCRRCHGDPFVGVSVVLQRSYNNFPVGPFQSDFWVLVRVGRFSYSHIFEVYPTHPLPYSFPRLHVIRQ